MEKQIKALVNDTTYEPSVREYKEPKFSGENNYFDVADRNFNKTCAIMTTQLKIPNISKLSVIEFYSLYEQVEQMIKTEQRWQS